MSKIDNILIQVRARLQSLSIKLWEEPYYFVGVGSVESEIDRLANEFSDDLSISISNCKLALAELQDGALRKLAARKEYEETGVATFSVRVVNNKEGTHSVLEVKCELNARGTELHAKIAEKLHLNDANQVKCISAGRIIDTEQTLSAQGVKNNQQLMAIISEVDQEANSSKEIVNDRIRKIKMDVEKIVDAKRQFFEMEDQDGNPVFLPPEENRSLLMAMSYCEKARAAMKREQYDEALILLLEADEKFSNCNSKFLEAVDNYALVNLDIVWCYLCLKNVTQLPDAQKRLEICEKSFRKSYGENLNRLIALKGKLCPERALLMRLHLLQGVVFFHQNRRNEAYEMLETANNELSELKVDESDVKSLVEMGYEPFEARLGLRASSGNVEEAINFIHQRKEKLRDARTRSKKERNINEKLTEEHKQDENWVNPRSACTLIEMGFSRPLVVEALKKCKNDIQRALDLLQTSSDELSKNLPKEQSVDMGFLQQLKELGFDENLARIALETTQNNIEKSIEFIVKLFGSEDELRSVVERLTNTSTLGAIVENNGPSTSSGKNTLVEKVLAQAVTEMESLQAYERFHADVTGHEEDYLDLPLLQEEQILAEYKRWLEQ